ncbi:hypothetical protein FACS189472_05270 [Alphaproteobacteria bacterium]|nr:hypothetical protein FACS189472_05270 [Alphaproteobacteria bacterium]
MIKRCSWGNSSEWLKKYHDDEWGKPLHDDRKLFEMLILEGKSCGLSWELILKKREHMRIVFDNFDPEVLVNYDDSKIDELLKWYKERNSAGKIISINLIDTCYLSANDFSVKGDAQKIMKQVGKIVEK